VTPNTVLPLSTAAVKLCCSDWAWMVVDNGELRIDTTANQDSPVITGTIPILGIDFWEHASYLRSQNRRPDYVSTFFNVINRERLNETCLAAIR